MTNTSIDPSEAKALRKLFHRVVDKAHKDFEAALLHSNQYGCQRKGPRRKRLLKAVRKHLRPVLIQMGRVDDTEVIVTWAPIGNDRLCIVVMTIDDKMRFEYRESQVDLSVHALERVIQFFHIRRFDVLDANLACLGSSLIKIEPGVDGRMVVHKASNPIGYLAYEDSVVTTFVGERSWGSNKRTKINRELAAMPA